MTKTGGEPTPELVYSLDMARYFEELEEKTELCYSIAESARKKGYDPKNKVEIPKAKDLAMRAQELTGVEDVADKIRELSKDHEREEVSLFIAEEVATRKEGSVRNRLDSAIRLGLAVLTEGILVAPLEGIGGVEIKQNSDGTDYVELSFAGPIRSAGGTGQAMSVLIADVVRRKLGIGSFKPTPGEIQRFKEEIPLYKRSKHLQYTPSPEEIELIVSGCPVSISGEGTEDEQVSGNRDLPRVETNRLRGGACLVIAEGMCLKAKKVKKYVDRLNISGWEFLEEYINKYAADKKSSENNQQKKGISPNFKYIKETIAGRPVFGHPMRKGGLRLRYGRARTTGLAAIAVNPATMVLTGEFMAIGTQIKIERPGKAGAITPCDSIEGPTVLLKNGTVKRVDDMDEALELVDQVKEILDVGEILIPYGEFVENNHILVPGAYCHEWWIQEADTDIDHDRIDAVKAVEFSRERGLPLHPKYVYFWDYSSVEEIDKLRSWISENGRVEKELVVKYSKDIKSISECMGIPHKKDREEMVFTEHQPLIFTLGLHEKTLEKLRESEKHDVMEYLSDLCGVPIRSKGPTSVGSRMARPEKAKERVMSPPVHALFPIGESGTNQRLIDKAVEAGLIQVQISAFKCTKCGKKGPQIRCSCGGSCEKTEDPPKDHKISMPSIYRQALKNLGEGGNVQKIKGVKGLITKNKIPEALEKGILRKKHSIFVFKDGTCRFDMTDLPLTHFKPVEIGLEVDKAREMGYTKDIHGDELERPDQMVEIKTQDVIASHSAGIYMLRVAKYVDDLLEKYYGMDRFYNAERPGDLLGHLVVGLAPHTSGGVLGRLIGYQRGRACYAHPYFHASKRRNCDGDEDCIMLLLDGLLNFSREFLPERRGGQMDAPLVLTTRINPDEIDEEAHNVDTLWRYPLEFYRSAQDYSDPKSVADIMQTVKNRLYTEGQYEKFGYTHDTSDISMGPIESKYTRLGKMTEKMEAQIRVAQMIRAVDAADVVSRVIEDHFIPDMLGNLNKFCLQTVRCTGCNKKYRRAPLSGKCDCGGNLTLTIHKGGVKKYLDKSLELTGRFDMPVYLKQRIQQISDQIDSLFENDKVCTPRLDEFC